jgi:hypothetical protein
MHMYPGGPGFLRQPQASLAFSRALPPTRSSTQAMPSEIFFHPCLLRIYSNPQVFGVAGFAVVRKLPLPSLMALPLPGPLARP